MFTFADMKEWSDKAANFLASCGIGRGDFVLVVLRRHYQFWFAALALASWARSWCRPPSCSRSTTWSTRLKGASIKAVVATSCGDIADSGGPRGGRVPHGKRRRIS